MILLILTHFKIMISQIQSRRLENIPVLKKSNIKVDTVHLSETHHGSQTSV